jgi:NTE family protein
MPPAPRTAFVLGGGGMLGANEVGMLRALFEAGHRPDLVVGTSVGALNGAVVAADPSEAAVERLTRLWVDLAGDTVFGGSGLARLRLMARTRTHLHDIAPLRRLLDHELGPLAVEDLAVPFQCCAACIERAAETWFTRGSLSQAVAASCAVPGLFPAVEIDGEHYLDGGIVNSVPVGRAVELGARTVFVLQVGRLEQPLTAPTKPWEVATVAFEVARRHRFARDMAALPEGVAVHLLPSGEQDAPTAPLRYRDTRKVPRRIAQAYEASVDYLEAFVPSPTGPSGSSRDVER